MNILLANLTKMVNDSGGLAKVTSNFANEMIQRGHTVSVVYSDEREGDFYYPVHNSVPTYDLRHFDGKTITYPWNYKIKREIYRVFSKQKARTINNDFTERYLLDNLQKVVNKVNPDIIISFQPAASKMLLINLNIKIPIITMSHGDPEDYFHTYPKGEIPAVEKSSLNQVLLPSFAKHITDHLPEAKTIVIGNAVYQNPEQVDLSKEKDIYKIIFVGRLSKNHKRPHLLIEAFAKLAKKYPNWHVEFWGAEDGKLYYQELKQKIKKYDLEHQVFLKGTTKEIIKELLNSDIYAIPSAYEGFSLAMTEAMQVGLPPIGFKNIPSVSELIEDGNTGILCDENTNDLSEKLEMLMNNRKLRIEIGNAARKSMEQYAENIIWDKWEYCMSSIVNR